MSKISKILFFLKIRRMKRLADKRYKTALKQGVKERDARHYIVKLSGEIRIISKLDFKFMKSRGIFPKTMTSDHLNKIALYKTK